MATRVAAVTASAIPQPRRRNLRLQNFPATDACTSTGNGVMFMNYMDYSDDNCLNIFTEEQATVMVGTINSFYSSLLSSDGCTPVNIAALDAGSTPLLLQQGAFCDTTIAPVVTLRNYGANVDQRQLQLFHRRRNGEHLCLDGQPGQSDLCGCQPAGNQRNRRTSHFHLLYQ